MSRAGQVSIAKRVAFSPSALFLPPPSPFSLLSSPLPSSGWSPTRMRLASSPRMVGLCVVTGSLNGCVRLVCERCVVDMVDIYHRANISRRSMCSQIITSHTPYFHWGSPLPASLGIAFACIANAVGFWSSHGLLASEVRLAGRPCGCSDLRKLASASGSCLACSRHLYLHYIVLRHSG